MIYCTSSEHMYEWVVAFNKLKVQSCPNPDHLRPAVKLADIGVEEDIINDEEPLPIGFSEGIMPTNMSKVVKAANRRV